MKLILQPLTHGPLIWKDKLPSDFKGWRLPGGHLQTSEGDFGTVCIQEYQTENFSIRLNVFDILQRFAVRSRMEGTGLFTRLILKGQVEQQIRNAEKYTLYRNMFTLQKSGAVFITDNYAEKLHIFFETSFSGKLIHDLVPLIPQAKNGITVLL